MQAPEANPHEKPPCGIPMETAPDQASDPLYKLVQQAQRRRPVLHVGEEDGFYGIPHMKK